jgi:vacuolar-type H+-ATPase catalytic subunit A/Vma1
MSSVNSNEGVLSYIGAVGASTANSGGSRAGGSSSSSNSWFEAMARAWGQRLDAQASRITELSDAIGSSGNDQPSNMVALTAESLRMQFLSQNASTSTNATAQALEAISKRQ